MISPSPLAQEKIWVDKAVYDLAEKRFYERLAKQQVCSSSSLNKERINEESKTSQKQCFIGFEKDGAGKFKSPEKVWVSKPMYDLAEKEYYEKIEKSRLVSLGKPRNLQEKVVNEKSVKVDVAEKVSDSADSLELKTKDNENPFVDKQRFRKKLHCFETIEISTNNLDTVENVNNDSEEVQNDNNFIELIPSDKSLSINKSNDKKKSIPISSPSQKMNPNDDKIIDPESKKRLRLDEPQEFKENPKPQKIRLTEEKYLCDSGKEKRKPSDEKKSQDNVAKGVSQNGNTWNSLAGEVAKARQHIKNSLQCIDDIASITSSNVVIEVNNRINSLEKENSEMKQKVKELTDLLAKFEQRLASIEKGSPNAASSKPLTANVSSQSAKPQTTSASSQSSKPTTATVSSQSSKPATANVSSQSTKPVCDDDEDDGVDLFASDSEEEDNEAAKIKEQRLAEYAAKKSKKPAVIAKSSIVLDVKPWDDTTDMKVMEKEVRKITTDGLLWGASKLVPLAYGIHKLQISCVVEDDKVSVDWLQETIEAIEDYVQSVDIAAFNKI